MVTKTFTKTLASCALGLSLLAGLAADAADTAPAAPEKPVIEMAPAKATEIGRHIIVTLHGVRGNADSYANFHQIIRDHLTKIDPAYRPITINFRYTVGKEGFDPFSVADQLNKQIEKALADSADAGMHAPAHITDNDKISVVAYSMGGQVGYAWFEETYNHPTKPEYKDYLKHMDLFFSLGGVYWGTHYSQIGVDVSSILSSLNINSVDLEKQLKAVHMGGIGGSEIANMSNISDVTQRLRDFRMQQARGLPGVNPRWISLMGLWPCFYDADPKTPGCQIPDYGIMDRITNLGKISALNANFNYLMNWVVGEFRHEADGPVPAANANFDFLFTQDLNPNYQNGAVTSKFMTTHPTAMPRTPLLEEVLHATVDGGKYVNDMVIILDKCKVPQTCDSPVYRHLLNALANCQRPNSTCVADGQSFINQFYANFQPLEKEEAALDKEMRAFSLDLNIRLPDGFQVPADLKKMYQNPGLAEMANKIRSEKFVQAAIDSKDLIDYLLANSENRKLLNYVRFAFDPKTDSIFEGGNIKTAPTAPYTVQVARPKEVLSVSFRYTEKDTSGHPAIIASIKGVVSPKVTDVKDLGSPEYLASKSQGVVVPFQINIPGLKIRNVQALVRPAYSTYVDVQMAK